MEQELQSLINTLMDRQKTMVEQLHQFCSINSGSDNLPGLNQMLTTLQAAFHDLSDQMDVKKLPPINVITMSGDTLQKTCGDALFIRKRPELKRRILLSGHMDTVYPADSHFQSLTYLNDNEVNGPGVSDMKGGLIVMLHALKAFEETEYSQSIGWDVLINADEELGSPASAFLFDELAPNYQAALVYEPAMTTTGTLAKNRKGSGKLTLIAKGKAAHAGRAFDEGRNAICYLAEALIEVQKLNGKRDGVTINVGLISGGEALNVVPDTAVAKLDIRIGHPDDEPWVMGALQDIKEKIKRPEYSLSIEGQFSRPVKRINSGTERLFQRLHSLGQQLGLNIDWKDSGGCCDGNNLAHHGLPVLDTLGVRGGHIHSPEEFILLDSLSERAALSALLLTDLAQGGLEDLRT